MNRRSFLTWIAAAALTLCVGLPSSAWAAYTELTCRSGGNNLNAGALDGSAETTAATAITVTGGDFVAGSSPTFTCPVGTSMTEMVVGRFVSFHPDGDAAPTVNQFKLARITAVNAGTRVVTALTLVNYGTALGSGTANRTMRVGGAWAGPSGAIGFPFDVITNAYVNVAGDFPRINFKSGTTYSITAAITHSTNGPIRFQGYTTTLGDGGRAIIDGGTSGASYVLLTLSAANCDLVDLICQNNGATGSATGVVISGVEDTFQRCVVNSVRGYGLSAATTAAYCFESEAYAFNQSNTASLAGFLINGTNSFAIRCISHDGVGSGSSGFSLGGGAALWFCIADTNGAHGVFSSTSSGGLIIGLDAYNNTGDGIRLANTASAIYCIENCNLIKNGGWGVNGSTAFARNGFIVGCGFGSGTQVNTLGTITGLSAMVESGSVTYAANVTPWVDPANGDFRNFLAAARSAGRGAFLQTAPSYGGTVSYPNIGASQSRSGVR